MKKLSEKVRKYTVWSLILIAIVIFYNTFHKPYSAPYTQEYIAGKGNIQGNLDPQTFLNKGKEFEIGANEYGYAVFKNPDAAFRKFKKQNKAGIREIQKEFNLLPLSMLTYELYGVYGWQITKGSEEVRKEARYVSSFLDIYENSYK